MIPNARTVKPWWRRALAWMFAEDITLYCARCHGRMPENESSEPCAVCFWCRHLEDLDMGRKATPEDTEALEQLHDRMVERQTMRRVLGRPNELRIGGVS